MSDYADNNILEMFGLSYEQSLLMFSAQKMVAKNDAAIVLTFILIADLLGIETRNPCSLSY